MYENINYKLVGIFVLLFSFLALAFGFWLAKQGVNKNAYNYYYAFFNESVDGLNKDSVVKLNGVNVGRVKAILIDAKYLPKVKVKMAIKKDIPITKDMYATLKSQGLTGLRYINIVGGSNKNDIILPNKEDSIIKTKKSLLSDISNTAPKTLNKLLDFTNRLNKLLSDENLNNINKILDNGSKLSAKALVIEEHIHNILNDFNNSKISNLFDIINDLNNSLTSTLIEYKKLAKKGDITLNTLNKKLPKLLNDFDRASIRIDKSAKLLNKTIKRGDYNLKRILAPAVVNLKELALDYKELADELKALSQNPAGAIFNAKTLPKGPGE